MPPVSDWYAGYCDAKDYDACDTSPYLEDEKPDYLQGYADGVDQNLQDDFGMSTPQGIQETWTPSN